MFKNKRLRFLWICAILTGAGFVLGGIGIAMGGIIHGIQIAPQGIRVYAPLLDKDTGKGNYIQKEEALEAFDSIQVDMEYADIRVEQSKDDTYTLSYCLSKDRKIQKEVSNGTLILQADSQNSFHWFFMGISSNSADQQESVTIRVPKSVNLSDVRLHTESGDIACENAQMDALDITAEYGDVSLYGILAQNIKMNMESGNLRMEQVQGGSCSVKNEYGSLSFYDLALTAELQAEMESGDIKFRDASAKGLELKSSYGNVTGQHTEFENIRMELESGDCRLEDLLFDRCEIDSSYGNVELDLKKDVTDYSYQLLTEYGDIEIGGKEMGEAYSSLEGKQERQIGIACESGNIRIN